MRVAPNVVVRMNVCNQSTRHGTRPSIIVIHSTESTNVVGPADLKNIGTWFNNPAAQASAHACTDADGQSARYVSDAAKAWHVAWYNAQSLGIEQIGRANQTSWPDAQIEETARWIAMWSERYDIPVRKGAVSRDGRVLRSGVLRHSELGHLGGDHHDPGPHFPMAECLRIARKIRNR